jgi:hypothetical protein
MIEKMEYRVYIAPETKKKRNMNLSVRVSFDCTRKAHTLNIE